MGQLNEHEKGVLIFEISKDINFAKASDSFHRFVEVITKTFNMHYGCVYELATAKSFSVNLLAEYYQNKNVISSAPVLEQETIKTLVKTSSFVEKNNVCTIFPMDALLTAINAESMVSFTAYDSQERIIGLVFFAGSNQVDTELAVEITSHFVEQINSQLQCLHTARLLEEKEMDYQNLVEASKDLIWEIDNQGYFTYVNKASYAIYGYRPAEMIGRRYSEFMSSKSASDFIDVSLQVLSGNSVSDVISNHVTKYGDLIQMMYSAKPKYDDTGDVVAITGTSTDVTESVRAKKAIQYNVEVFSSILGRMPVIFFRIDKNGILVDIRGKGLQRMGVKDMDWVGKPGYGLFVGMDKMIDSALSGETVIFESKGRFEGRPWWFLTSIFFDSWTNFGAVGFSVDITEQKLGEEQLVHLLNDNRKLAQRLVEIQEEERRNLARELHDELGQSITAVKSLATAVKTQAGDAYSEIRSLGNSIIDLSGRLYDVVSNIMHRLRPDIIDSLGFDEAIYNCVERSQLETMGIKCEVNIIGDINSLDEVVKISVYRIIQECLTNISKYAMASNVKVVIKREIKTVADRRLHSMNVIKDNGDSLVFNQDTLLVSVEDDGVGMDVISAQKSTKKKKRMGLQGIKERVTALSGHLNIISDKGHGVKVSALLDLNTKMTKLNNLHIVKG